MKNLITLCCWYVKINFCNVVKGYCKTKFGDDTVKHESLQIKKHPPWHGEGEIVYINNKKTKALANLPPTMTRTKSGPSVSVDSRKMKKSHQEGEEHRATTKSCFESIHEENNTGTQNVIDAILRHWWMEICKCYFLKIKNQERFFKTPYLPPRNDSWKRQP